MKGTIHWVSAAHAVDAEVRLYDHLFTQARPGRRAGGPGLPGEPEPEVAGGADGLQAGAEPGGRGGRAAATSSSGRATSASIKDSTPGKLVFNRTVTLRDTWAKIEKGQKKKG